MNRAVLDPTDEAVTKSFLTRVQQLRLNDQAFKERFGNRPPFSYDEWAREQGPASTEELLEMEDWLREREAERDQYREGVLE